MKFSNSFLAILLLALIGFFAANYFFGTDKKRSFKKDLASIDSSKVTSIILHPTAMEGKKLTFEKQDTTWTVAKEDSTAEAANTDLVNYMVGSLLQLKSKRLATTKKEKWEEYQVAEQKGTRVQVMEGSDKTLDLYVGKFSMQQPKPQAPGQQPNPMQMQQQQQQQPKMLTYVRLNGEDNVYAVDGMLSMAFNRAAKDFLAPEPEPEVVDSLDTAIPDSLQTAVPDTVAAE